MKPAACMSMSEYDTKKGIGRGNACIAETLQTYMRVCLCWHAEVVHAHAFPYLIVATEPKNRDRPSVSLISTKTWTCPGRAHCACAVIVAAGGWPRAIQRARVPASPRRPDGRTDATSKLAASADCSTYSIRLLPRGIGIGCCLPARTALSHSLPGKRGPSTSPPWDALARAVDGRFKSLAVGVSSCSLPRHSTVTSYLK